MTACLSLPHPLFPGCPLWTKEDSPFALYFFKDGRTGNGFVPFGFCQDRELSLALEAMPLEERLLLEKKYILLWPDSEIAEQLGIKPDSMRMRYTRAKRKVEKALLAKGFSPEDLF